MFGLATAWKLYSSQGFSARVLAFNSTVRTLRSPAFTTSSLAKVIAEFELLVVVTIELFRYKTIDDGVRVYAKLLKGAWLVNLTKPVDHQ